MIQHQMIQHQTRSNLQYAPTETEAIGVPVHEIESTVMGSLVRLLANCGVAHAFGVSGGAIAVGFDAVTRSSIGLHHCRHETGAAFAATEAYFASRRPSLVLCTTGPGLLNVLTGMTAARWDGAKVVLISGSTNAAQRGRWATQETSSYTLPQDGLYTSGPIFDFATRIEDPAELPQIARRIQLGLKRPGGFIAHVSIPMSVQSALVTRPEHEARVEVLPPSFSQTQVAACAELLQPGTFALWIGFGARDAVDEVRALVDRTGASVICSPRAKGIVPEDDPRFLGVTGIGGDPRLPERLTHCRPDWTLVLGSKLGEATSFWDPALTPRQGFIHVDLDPAVPGTAYPEVATIAVQADIAEFVSVLLKELWSRGVKPASSPELPRRFAARTAELQPGRRPVRPRALMGAIQDRIIDRSPATILAECGSSFAWASRYLTFRDPDRYRVSTLFGSMGHAASGVIGAAIARREPAVAVLGDGSMLMNQEICTAVKYRAHAIWIVLNDAGYGMCRDGHRALGLDEAELDSPRVDFAALARAQGADGLVIDDEGMLADALDLALEAGGPFVVDVHIDTSEISPLAQRFKSLMQQGSRSPAAG